MACAIGSTNTSSGVWITPSGPRRMSSKVPGSRSGPGSTTRPTILVPVMGALLTVVNVTCAVPPETPLPSPSRKAPSAAARIADPTTWTVILAPPGSGLVGNSQAYVPSAAATIVMSSFLPSGPVA